MVVTYQAWHSSLDAQPSIINTHDGGPLGLRLLVGSVGGGPGDRVAVEYQTRRGSGPWAGGDTVVATIADTTRNLGLADQRPGRVGERIDRGYLLADKWRRAFGNTYWEAEIADLPNGTQVQYTIVAMPASGEAPVRLGPFQIVVTDPDFAHPSLGGGRSGEVSWVAYAVFAEIDGCPVTHLRIDLDDISIGAVTDASLPAGPFAPSIPVQFRLDGIWMTMDPVAAAAATTTDDAHRLPLVDWATDRISMTVPGRFSDIWVEVDGRTITLDPADELGTTRLLLEHFAIQGFNDLLERPFSGPVDRSYQPPRTYMQVTMRDDKGTFSSRPDVTTPGVDGYSYGFDAHRRFAVPYELALNGGLLTLITHDCREQNGWPADGDGLASMKSDIAAGLLHPTIAGYGSHRTPYYSAETNQQDITWCRQVETTLLGASRPVFYPDQRLYRAAPNTVGVFRDTGIEYTVFDADSGYRRNLNSIRPSGNAGGADVTANLLWQDERSGVYLLFIDDALKDSIAAAGTDDWPKPTLDLRRRLIRYAVDPQLAGNLLVYGDDFEKACGNGWFEGGQTREHFCAFLEWISASRPWLRAVTTADLDPAKDCVGTIDVQTATDPMLGYTDQGQLQFDLWVDAWKNYPASWIGGT